MYQRNWGWNDGETVNGIPDEGESIVTKISQEKQGLWNQRTSANGKFHKINSFAPPHPAANNVLLYNPGIRYPSTR